MIEFAEQVEAKCAVLHAGRFPFLCCHGIRLLGKRTRRVSSEVKRSDRRRRDRLGRVLTKLRRRAPQTRQRVCHCFKQVGAFAKERHIWLGIENRESILEFPLDEARQAFVADLSRVGPFGYWHDVGHAAIKARQGILDTKQHI